MKEINPRKTIAVEFDIEEFMLLTTLVGVSSMNMNKEAFKKMFSSELKNADIGYTLYSQMAEVLRKYGIENNYD